MKLRRGEKKIFWLVCLSFRAELGDLLYKGGQEGKVTLETKKFTFSFFKKKKKNCYEYLNCLKDQIVIDL